MLFDDKKINKSIFYKNTRLIQIDNVDAYVDVDDKILVSL